MQELVKKANKSVSKFDIMDWSIFKTSMILFGVIVGSAFPVKCKKLMPILFIVWIACVYYVIIRVYLVPYKR
ncbi:MAG: hypothetical protein ATN32_01800 [Candidatus Epulonipiscium fishelsonii]|nr:MAG: hypothetical protein ATN32_01800 [Epulopiscium sp. AS2M-Bin002]